MGASGSKWRKAAVGPPLPAEEASAGGRNRKRRGKEEERGSGIGSQFADEPEPEPEPGPATAERGHWTLSLRLEGEGGSPRRSNTSTWRLPKAPCGDCTPSIRCLAGHRAAAGSPVNARQPRAEGEPTGCKLSTSPTSLPNPTHDVFMVKTRDKENNNSVNGCQISGENVSHNLTPILYDYSEEELMASIEKEYS